MKKVFRVKPNAEGTTHIKFDTHYDLGGFSYATYRREPRGYYASAQPIKIKEHDGWSSESFTAFTGTKWILKEVKRKSAKAETEAMAIATKGMRAMVEYVAKKNGLELAEEIA